MSTLSPTAKLGDPAVRNVGHGCRVLVVDDVPDTVVTLGMLLRSEGFEVEQVTDSREVSNAVARFRPEIVLLDIGMPGRNGYEVAEELKRVYGEACPILVAITAYGDRANKGWARMFGFEHHLVKPYNPAELIDLLHLLKRLAPRRES
jgi:CheY-like chemotaxis protein